MAACETCGRTGKCQTCCCVNPAHDRGAPCPTCEHGEPEPGSVAQCRHCQRRIVRINFSLGAKWMHQPEGSSFQDNMYEWCKKTTAGPANEPNPITYPGPV